MPKLKKRHYILCMPLNWIRTLTTLLVFLFLTSCSTAPKTCQELDWYEIGRRDGASVQNGKGRRQAVAVCKDSDQSLCEALYTNGFDSSIVQYCTAKNGFELGLAKVAAIENVCPPLLRDEFMMSYKQGQRYKEITDEQTTISNRLIKLDNDLSDSSIEIVKRGLISGSKLELIEKNKTLNHELGEIKKAQAKN